LNFYSFRKIKFSDSIRIDYETEKKTANYWRFRHEHFQQGRPDLLVHIKRTPNGKGSGAIPSAAANSEAKPSEISSASNLIPAVSAVVTTGDKSEVQTLKKRIDEMTKNMDALTEMVQKVSLQQQQQQAESELPGTKRKKLASEELMALQSPLPDGVLSAPLMDLDELPLMDSVGSIELIPPAPVPFSESRESSLDGNEFVDQLFTAFHEDEGLLGSLDGSASSLEEPTTSAIGSFPSSNSNRPDPELMKRLSDALELLPKETQEMIVNRLIAAITSTDFLALGMPSDPKEQQQHPQPTPLAAATFAALLQHYTNQIKESKSRKNGGPSSSDEAQSSAKKQLQKTIPVIPVHA
jgi:heat shock transcription factor 2